MPFKDQLMHFYNKKQAENMFCLEFDLRDHSTIVDPNQSESEQQQAKVNRKFRIIN